MQSNIEFLYEQLRQATDGGSESMSHDDALRQIAHWRNQSRIQQSVEPAFPYVCREAEHYSTGMTLRDYFAAKALAAMIGNESKDGINRGKAGVRNLAKFAYEFADAMLEERHA